MVIYGQETVGLIAKLVWLVLIAVAVVVALNMTMAVIGGAAQLVKDVANLFGRRKQPEVRESLAVLARLALWMPGLIAGSILAALACAGSAALLLRLLGK